MNERFVDDPSPTERQRDLLTGHEAADLLPGVSYEALMRWARRGQVPSTQYVKGGRRLFRRSDIEVLLRPVAGSAPSAGSAAEPSGSSGEVPGQGALL